MPAPTRSLLRLEVPFIVRLAERMMAVDELLQLAPGAIVELPKKADEDLDLIVNNQPIGRGRALKVGERFGIQVTSLGDFGGRLEAVRAAAPNRSADSAPRSG